ncbi:MAG: hypothetical protein EXS39_02090 [Opitutaceae bacterium]|nr:hypothetical protein [Opitutaceae bacterium]
MLLPPAVRRSFPLLPLFLNTLDTLGFGVSLPLALSGDTGRKLPKSTGLGSHNLLVIFSRFPSFRIPPAKNHLLSLAPGGLSPGPQSRAFFSDAAGGVGAADSSEDFGAGSFILLEFLPITAPFTHPTFLIIAVVGLGR